MDKQWCEDLQEATDEPKELKPEIMPVFYCHKCGGFSCIHEHYITDKAGVKRLVCLHCGAGYFSLSYPQRQ